MAGMIAPMDMMDNPAPFTPGELHEFARHNLRIVQDGKLRPSADYPAAVDHYAGLAAQLPPDFQRMLIGSGRTTVMIDPRDMLRYREENCLDAATPLGWFMRKPARDIGRDAIFWGGMFETRRRSTLGTPVESYVTFAHELGHRIDSILALRFVSAAPSFTMYSFNPQWRHRVDAQLDRMHDSFYTPPPALYHGMRLLTDHLSLPAYQGRTRQERADHAACEAFAEMTAHYAMAYQAGNGNAAAIDALLDEHYPILWPSYRDHALPRIAAEAKLLWNDIACQQAEILWHEENLAQLQGTPFNAEEREGELRLASIRGGKPRIVEQAKHSGRNYWLRMNPAMVYSAATDKLDALRHRLNPAAPSCADPDWREFLGNPEVTYKDCQRRGMDVAAEIHRLEQEHHCLEKFAHTFKDLNTELNASPASDRWILDDFEHLHRSSGRRHMETVESLLSRSTPHILRRYLGALRAENTMLHDNRPFCAQTARAARHAMYHRLLAGSCEAYIGTIGHLQQEQAAFMENARQHDPAFKSHVKDVLRTFRAALRERVALGEFAEIGDPLPPPGKPESDCAYGGTLHPIPTFTPSR